MSLTVSPCISLISGPDCITSARSCVRFNSTVGLGVKKKKRKKKKLSVKHQMSKNRHYSCCCFHFNNFSVT